MTITTLRIATRQSALAMWQATEIKRQVVQAHPGLDVVLVPMTTEGDIRLDKALYSIGGKGLFIKALEESLLAGETDIAVHSMKDIPPVFPEGFILASVSERESPWDVLVSPRGFTLETLPKGAVIGTASLRRHAQIIRLRPDVTVKLLRGNVNSRLKKCEAGDYDALIMAHAGLLRLGLDKHITHIFSEDEMLPAVGQGVLGIECLASRVDLRALLNPLHHHETSARVRAERSMSAALGGGCHAPVAGYTALRGGLLVLKGAVFNLEGQAVYVEAEGPISDPEQLGLSVAQQLLDKGAGELMQSVMHG